ncbi:MAG TPA: alpha/beta fold hydrolase [Gemmatimonadales bacterium]|nr:alpha/beta fold hydrolase [Gemmatimonadales bacterium]
MIHGFPFDHRMWDHVQRVLQRRAYATDVAGTGASRGYDSPDAYTMAAYAADFAGLLDGMMTPQGVFCGLSMGGYIVFELLRRFPARVRAAILCNTKAAADAPETKRGRDALAARTKQEGMSAVVDELINRVLARVTRERRPDVVQEVTAMILRQHVPGIVGALHAMRERPDSTPLLGEIRVPVLVIAGDDDPIAPAEGMKEMARAIPGAQFVLIPEAGHLSPVEQPQAVGAAINAFLARL